MSHDEKAYRSLSVRLSLEDYKKFEEARGILQERAKSAGVSTTVSKPELINHLLKIFFDNNSDKTDNTKT